MLGIVKPSMNQLAAATDAGDTNTNAEGLDGLESDDKNMLSIPDTTNVINGSSVENGGDVKNIEAQLTNDIVGGKRPFMCMECDQSFRTARSLKAHLRSHRDDRRYQCSECGKWFRRASGRNEHIRNVHQGLKAHQCDRCPRAFSTSNALKLHIMGHTNERPHACDKCPKRFKNVTLLNLHIRNVHEGQRSYLCDRCPQAFTTLSGLRLHTKRHTNETHSSESNDVAVEYIEAQLINDKLGSKPEDQPQKGDLQKASKLCTVCGELFQGLKAHMRLHRRPNYECPDCGRTFAQKYYLSKHRHVHSTEKSFLCMNCGRGFKAAGGLKAHMRSHSDDRHYQCNECGKFFRRSSGRNEHVRNVHQGLKAHQCDRCPRAFSTSNALKLHIMGHTNERPHACDKCPKRFKNVTLLNLHLGTHAGRREFPCRFCGYRFTQRSAARVHEATQHSEDGGRRHLCELCGQRFNRRSIRDAHVRRHKGEKPYACSMCNWTFATVGDLRNHTVNKHKVKSSASAGRSKQLLA